MDGIMLEAEAPTTEQFSLLRVVCDRVLLEFQSEKEGVHLPREHRARRIAECPLLAFCHGCPGTGKSRVIKWIRRMFEEALGWSHHDEFMCVAFQNRVAHAMGGSTIHSGGDIGVGSQRTSQLQHADIDVLFTRNH